MGPGPYFIGNPGEIKDNRGSDKIPGRRSGAEDCSSQCNVYSGGGCTVQYSTVQSGARRAEGGAGSGCEWHSLSDSMHRDTGDTRPAITMSVIQIKMIGSDRDNFQTPEITKPEKCCENLIKMQNKIVEFEFSDDKICLIELVKIKLVSVLIKRGSVFCRVLSYTIKKCQCFF